MAEKFSPFYILLKTEVAIKDTSELKETFDSVNKALSDDRLLAIRKPIRGKQLVLKTDASFKSAGYGLMVQDNPVKKYIQSGKRTPPWCLAPKFSTPRNPKCPCTQRKL